MKGTPVCIARKTNLTPSENENLELKILIEMAQEKQKTALQSDLLIKFNPSYISAEKTTQMLTGKNDKQNHCFPLENC